MLAAMAGQRTLQTVSVAFDEPEETSMTTTTTSKLQIMSECVETRTVTTTTTTKRVFPPLYVRNPQEVDASGKEYPLAAVAAPSELLNFSFETPASDEWHTGNSLRLGRVDAGDKSNDVDDESRSLVRHRTPRQTTDGLRRSLASVNRGSQKTTTFLATPDATDVAGGSGRVMADDRRRGSSYETTSPTGSDFQTFGSNVATPPVEGDVLVVGDTLQESIRSSQRRPTIDVVTAQDAALPSPRLSPTLASSGRQTRNRRESGDDSDDGDDKGYMEGNGLGLVHQQRRANVGEISIVQLLEAFETMPDRMKTFTMYQMLRRCPRPTLRIVAGAVEPIMKRDFLRLLPMELRWQIMSYLNHTDMCRAAQVSKAWRLISDCNEIGWKRLFDEAGFVLEDGELERAIVEGWGWQDPVGVQDHERDLVAEARMEERRAAAEVVEVTAEVDVKPPPPAGPTTRSERTLRASKRKREVSNGSTSRSKRRVAFSAPSGAASTADEEEVMVLSSRTIPAAPTPVKVEEPPVARPSIKLNPEEGPISAADAALAAMPDPVALGDKFPAMRRMHLFKSLYRRHYHIRNSWTHGGVLPGHVAFAAHPRHVITCLQFDEDKVITGSDDMEIHIYDTKTGRLRRRLEGHEGGVWALQYEGNVLVSGSTDRAVRVWNIAEGICTQVFNAHTSTVRCLQILMPSMMPDGTMMPRQPLIITGSRDHTLRVWVLPASTSVPAASTDISTMDVDCPYFRRTLSGHTNSVRAIAAHGDTLASGSYDGTVRVWRISTGEQRHVLSGHAQKVYSVALDPSRNLVVSGSMDSHVKIWDLTTGACIHTLEGHSLLVGLLDVRDDRLVSAAADSTLRVWDPSSGRCRHVLTAHTGAITCFQHDGRKVVSGSDKAVKIWDMVSGDCIHDLLTDLGGVWQVKFNHRRCVAAVQRDSITYIEILDFGAARDGLAPSKLGVRRVINDDEAQQARQAEMDAQAANPIEPQP